MSDFPLVYSTLFYLDIKDLSEEELPIFFDHNESYASKRPDSSLLDSKCLIFGYDDKNFQS
ncbi:hypothetical protein HMPREF9320_1167 [Streptococcus pseudoporcinus SPIN 20026]|nr:hypothetical protein HMPREF9320_1167 [Streptococcus pseudoporcinus SPIN 20026]